MGYKLSLEHRRRVAKRRNERYRLDADYRLSRINGRRQRDGRPLIESLDETTLRIPLEIR